MRSSQLGFWCLIAFAGLLDCGGDRSNPSNPGLHTDGGVDATASGGVGGRVGSGGSAGTAGAAGAAGSDGGTETDSGMEDRTVDAALALRPPPPDTPRPPEVDNCNFGGAPGNVTALVPPGSATLLAVGPTWVTFAERTVRECRLVGSNTIVCSYDHWLRRVPRCGGPVETLGSAFASPFTRLVQGGGRVYALSNELFRIDESNGKREVIGACATDVAAGPDSVVFFDRCAGALMHGPHDATTFARIDLPPANSATLAIGSSIVYFTTEQGIGWASLTTQDRGLLADGPLPLSVIELGADHRSLFVQWAQDDAASADGYYVRRIPLAGGAKADFGPWDVGVDGFPAIAVGGGFGYHAAAGSGIVRIPSDGSAPGETRVRREYSDIGVYGERIYWTERGALLTAVRQGDRGVCEQERAPSSLKVLASTGDFTLHDVALDATGNAVVIGVADGVTDLGGGPLAADGDHMILAKLDRAGSHVWSRLVPSGSDTRLAVGGTGIVTVATAQSVSRFSAAGAPLDSQPHEAIQPQVDADAQGNSFVLWSGTDRGVRLLSRNAAGAERWRREIVAASNDYAFYPWSLSAAGDGGAFITGALYATLNLGDGPREKGALPTTLVARYGADGRLVWSRRIVGDRHPEDFGVGGGGASVAATAGGAVIVGTTEFWVDAGTGPVVVPQAFDVYGYVVRLGADGTPASTRLLDVPGLSASVVADSDLYVVTGPCRPSTPVGPDGTEPTIIARLDQNDSVVWTGRIDSFTGVSIDADTRGAVVVGKGLQLGQAGDAQALPDDPFFATFAR